MAKINKKNLRNSVNNITIKIDMYQANKSMAIRVRDFAVRKLWKKTIEAQFADCAEVYESRIDSMRNLLVMPDYKARAEKEIAHYEASIAVLEEAKQEQIREEAKFDFTPADKRLYRERCDATTDALAYKAILNWFASFDDSEHHFAKYLATNPDGVKLLKMLDTAMGGETDKTPTELFKELQKTGTREVTELSKLRGQTAVLRAFYAKLFDFMMFKGTISKVIYPEYLWGFLTKKQEEAKALRQQAKALVKKA